jgi:hypothetical protein
LPRRRPDATATGEGRGMLWPGSTLPAFGSQPALPNRDRLVIAYALKNISVAETDLGKTGSKNKSSGEQPGASSSHGKIRRQR